MTGGQGSTQWTEAATVLHAEPTFLKKSQGRQHVTQGVMNGSVSGKEQCWRRKHPSEQGHPGRDHPLWTPHSGQHSVAKLGLPEMPTFGKSLTSPGPQFAL
jgi:hypothetical protein